MITSKISIQTQGSANPEKQVAFAAASALTLTATEIKIAEIKAIDETFTVRTNWNKVGPYAVKVQAAKKTDWPRPFSIVGTAADFIEKFLEGPVGSIALKIPQGEFIAIPTSNVRRTKRDIIRAAQRPRALRGKHDFLVPMKSGQGFVLFQKQGRGKSKRNVALYLLVKSAKIRERDPLFEPALKVFVKRFGAILDQQVAKAFATAR
jgi:hypothetical protein